MSIENTRENKISRSTLILGSVWILLFFIGSCYVLDVPMAVFSLFILSMYIVVGALFFFAIRLFLKKPVEFWFLLKKLFLRSGVTILISFTLVWSFLVYQNEIDPAKLGIYPLSNGTKQVEFHSMAHIASERFYADTESWVRAKKAQGYTLFFEWVRPGTLESHKKFDSLLGFQFSSDLYAQFSRLYGLTQQDNKRFLGMSGALDENVDISIDDLVQYYESKYGPIETGTNVSTGVVISSGSLTLTGKAISSWAIVQTSGTGVSFTGTSALHKETEVEVKPSSEVVSADQMEQEISKIISSLSERQLQIIRYFNRGILNFMIKHKAFGMQDSSLIAAPGLFDVILHERNRHLVEAILQSKSDKIIILYGDLHFDGVFDLLQESDSKWKLSSDIQWSAPLNP